MSMSAPEGGAGVLACESAVNRTGCAAADFCRFISPGIEQFKHAADVCYTRWSYMRQVDGPARFRAFQQMGVELCAMMDAAGVMQSVAYLIPSRMELWGEILSWHYMFQLASRPGMPGAGALLVRQIMKWYPAIFGMGITPDAERLYQAFRWQPHDGFWRGVHFLNLSRTLRDHGDRIRHAWLRRLLQASAGVYNLASRSLATLLSLGLRCEPYRPQGGKERVLAGYLTLLASGGTRVVDVGGAGRILSLSDANSLRQHAAIWRTLWRRNAKFCEMLLFSDATRARAWRLGYLPLRLPVWCWDPHGVLARAIPALRQRGISFLDTDKVV